MPQLRNLLISAFALAVVICVSSAVADARQIELRGDKAVMFTFSQPVALPGVTLPAGKYLFRLADSQTNRSVVQVYSADGRRLFGMMMTIPMERRTRIDNPQVNFMEAAASQPVPIRSYWFPGTQGWEFIYPRSQALVLAKNSKEPVLTTAKDASEDEMKATDLARVNASGSAVPYSQSDSQSAVSGSSASGEVAAANEPAPANTPAAAAPARAPISQNASAAPARTRLPQTAGTTASVGLAGVMALCAALALGLTRRRSV